MPPPQMEKALLVDRKFKQALRLFEQANTVRHLEARAADRDERERASTVGRGVDGGGESFWGGQGDFPHSLDK